MAEQVVWATGNPRFEETLLLWYKLAEADMLTQRVMTSAELAGEKGLAVGIQAETALRAALFGRAQEAKRLALAATQRSGRMPIKARNHSRVA